VPPTGQKFTSLEKLKEEGHENVWSQDSHNPKIWSVRTEPAVGIGQRAILIQTPKGNVLWDLITYLDQPTLDKVQSLGGLSAIVISHPHYYSTWADWSRTFRCPVYVARADEEWVEYPNPESSGAEIRWLEEEKTDVCGIQVVVAGGHFPGSLLACWEGVLFIADTVIMAPSALNPEPGKEGVVSFGFVSVV
jgi:glyoxylase-like metal-dependent hydrolase (beta-lactamase superfamily II)